MPLGRGERIGEAYVRILLDGEGLKDDLIEALEGTEADIQQQGDRGSKAYQKGWHDQIIKGEMRRDVEESLEVGAGRMDAIAAQVAELYSSRLRHNLRQRVGTRIGDEIFEGLVGRFSKTGNFEGLRRDIENLGTLTQEVTADITKAEDDLAKERVRNAEKMARMHREGGRAFLANLREMQMEYQHIIKGQRASTDEIRKAHIALDKLNVEAKKYSGLMGKDSNKDIIDNLASMRRGLITSTPHLDRFHHRMNTMIPVMAHLFGKGSRNNFLNFFGSMVGNLLRVIPAISGATSKFIGFERLFRSGFTAARRDGDGFFRAMRAGFSGLAEGGFSFARLATSIASFAFSLGGVVIVVGTVIAAFSLLAGIAAALASTIGFALVAAIGAFAAVLLPLIGLIGGFVIAMKSMTQAQFTELKKSFQNFSKPFTKSFRDEMPNALKHFNQALRSVQVKEFADKMGTAIGKVVTSFAKGLRSPEFQSFLKAMTDWLPGAITKLGTIMRNTFGGLGGLFRGMIPFMTDVLNWLIKITDQFSKWANSPKGQNEIADFFERAKQSAKAFGDFLGSVWGLIKQVLSAGKDTGDNIFTSMAKGIDKWTKKLQDNPGILKKWFEDAKKFADVLGRLVTGIGRLVAILDNSFTRSLATGFVAALGTLAKVLGTLDKATGGGLGVALGVIGAGILTLWAGGKLLAIAKGLRTLAIALGLMKAVGTVSVISGGAAGLGAGAAAGGGFAAMAAGLKNRFAAAFKGMGKFLWRAGGPLLAIDMALQVLTRMDKDKSNDGGIGKEIAAEVAYARTAWNDFRAFIGQPLMVKMNTAELKAAETAMNTLSSKFKNTFLTPLFPKVNLTSISSLNTLLGNTKTKADQAKASDATPKANGQPIKTVNDALSSMIGTAVRSKGTDATPKANAAAMTPLQAALGGVLTKAQQSHMQDATPKVQGGGFFGGIIGTLGTILQTAIKANQQDATPKVGAPTGLGAALGGLGKLSTSMSGITSKPAKPRAEDGGTFGKVSGQAGRLRTAIGGIPKSAKTTASDGGTFGKIRTLAANLKKAIEQVPKSPKVKMTEAGSAEGKRRVDALKKAIAGLRDKTVTITTVERTVTRARGGITDGSLSLAAGGFANFRQKYGNNIIGESGREAIVPLDRPLGMVDPSVRDLAAFAQGKGGIGGITNSKVIDASGWTIQTDTADPHAVAKEVLNEMTGRLL